MTKLQPELIDLLQMAYSAERAASFAYIGHAASLKNIQEITEVKQIENDEWLHRKEVLSIMNEYNIAVSKCYEIRFYIIGKIIGYSCYVIGYFMPFYFAGRLESGNVCEYFRMKEFFNQLGIHKHDDILLAMGIKEKEHEDYFLKKVIYHPWLPFFQKVFKWGRGYSFNNMVDSSDLKNTGFCQKNN